MLFPTRHTGATLTNCYPRERMERIILPPTNDYLRVLILFFSSSSLSSCLDDFIYKVFQSTRLEKVILEAISSKFSFRENFRFAFVHELLKETRWPITWLALNATARHDTRTVIGHSVFLCFCSKSPLAENHRLILVDSTRNANAYNYNYYLNIEITCINFLLRGK